MLEVRWKGGLGRGLSKEVWKPLQFLDSVRAARSRVICGVGHPQAMQKLSLYPALGMP